LEKISLFSKTKAKPSYDNYVESCFKRSLGLSMDESKCNDDHNTKKMLNLKSSSSKATVSTSAETVLTNNSDSNNNSQSPIKKRRSSGSFAIHHHLDQIEDDDDDDIDVDDNIAANKKLQIGPQSLPKAAFVSKTISVDGRIHKKSNSGEKSVDKTIIEGDTSTLSGGSISGGSSGGSSASSSASSSARGSSKHKEKNTTSNSTPTTTVSPTKKTNQQTILHLFTTLPGVGKYLSKVLDHPFQQMMECMKNEWSKSSQYANTMFYSLTNTMFYSYNLTQIHQLCTRKEQEKKFRILLFLKLGIHL